MNDGDLVRAIQDGDLASLTTLYQRHVYGVWRYVHAHLSRDVEETEDVVSETFLAAIRTIRTFDPQRGTVSGWLLGIARNKLRDHFRRARRAVRCAPAGAGTAADADSRGPDGSLIAAETRDAVIRALNTLGDEERLALEWKYIDSLSVREIAERLGRTEKAAEAILYRARVSFRTVYAREQT